MACACWFVFCVLLGIGGVWHRVLVCAWFVVCRCDVGFSCFRLLLLYSVMLLGGGLELLISSCFWSMPLSGLQSFGLCATGWRVCRFLCFVCCWDFGFMALYCGVVGKWSGVVGLADVFSFSGALGLVSVCVGLSSAVGLWSCFGQAGAVGL